MLTSEYAYDKAVFSTVEEALTNVSTSKRYRGLVLYIETEDKLYWFRDGVTNSDLIAYTPSVYTFSVANLTDLYAIPMTLREAGTEAVLIAENRVVRYKLVNGIDNASWAEIGSPYIPHSGPSPVNPQPIPQPVPGPIPPSNPDDSDSIYKTTITGNGSTKEFTITHNLDSEFVKVLFYDSLKQMVYICFSKDNNNTITLHFDYPLDSGDVIEVICRK